MTQSYNTEENERVPIILTLLGTEIFQFVQKPSGKEQERSKTYMGLFEIRSERF